MERERELRLPCGRCIGCRLERKRQWAVRLMHESQSWRDRWFLTLTYDDDHLPENGSLVREEVPLFIKRLRKSREVRRRNPETGRMKNYSGPPLKSFYCGEYGAERLRPHYHVILFGHDFSDMLRVDESKSGHPQWMSPQLDRLWQHRGGAWIGAVTFESCAYVAGYTVKKWTGEAARERYTRLDPSTGELVEVLPEFGGMSRRPGIGREWIEKYSSEVYPADEVIMRGYPAKPPRYYDQYLESVDEDAAKAVREERDANRLEEPYERLPVREVCAEARAGLYSRGVD